MTSSMKFALIFGIAIYFLSTTSLAKKMNVVDTCWRSDPQWRDHREKLATCSVGYTGKLNAFTESDVKFYKVTDPSDDNPLCPKRGTLRYGVTQIKGKVWITFEENMNIKLQKPLLVGSYTVIDGRGANVHISGGACLTIYKASNIIIHGLWIHHCQGYGPGEIMGPEGKVIRIGSIDGDAIRLVTASNIWLDHNTLYKCEDGLVDVTLGSSNVTITNNWFRDQNKVMLLGHDDGYIRDKNMKVTVAFNHFGPNCHQRMPRVRHGYAHVANNLYQGWGLYAIGGSMNPSIKSQSNLFVAPKTGKKEVTWKKNHVVGGSWSFASVRDIFENGASFDQTCDDGNSVKPNYSPEEKFPVKDARSVRLLTRDSGALKCPRASTC